MKSSANPRAIPNGVVRRSMDSQCQAAILVHSGVGAYLGRLSHMAFAMTFVIASKGDDWAMVQPAALVIAENSMLGRICSGSRLVRILGVELLGYCVSV
jgi:hypothetical protein